MTGQSGLGEVGGTVVYDDGNGAAEVSVLVYVPYTFHGTTQRKAKGSLCPSIQDGDPCTDLPDGSQITVYQGDANISGGAKDWEVRLLRADGVEVDITEWNSPVEKGGTQTRSNPPFTTAELTTIARSPKWKATATAATTRTASKLFRPERNP